MALISFRPKVGLVRATFERHLLSTIKECRHDNCLSRTGMILAYVSNVSLLQDAEGLQKCRKGYINVAT